MWNPFKIFLSIIAVLAGLLVFRAMFFPSTVTSVTTYSSEYNNPATRFTHPKYIDCLVNHSAVPPEEYINERIANGDPLEDFSYPGFYYAMPGLVNYHCMSARHDKWNLKGPHGEWKTNIEKHIKMMELKAKYDTGDYTSNDVFELAKSITNNSKIYNHKQIELFYEAAKLGHPQSKILVFTGDVKRNNKGKYDKIKVGYKGRSGAMKSTEIDTSLLPKNTQHLAICPNAEEKERCFLYQLHFMDGELYFPIMRGSADSCDKGTLEECWAE